MFAKLFAEWGSDRVQGFLIEPTVSCVRQEWVERFAKPVGWKSRIVANYCDTQPIAMFSWGSVAG